MCIEQEISDYLTRSTKFEYFLIHHNPSFAKRKSDKKIIGINWEALADHIERSHSFATATQNFSTLKSQPPGFLVIRNEQVEWEPNCAIIETWKDFLINSFAQLRNNVAHGSKAHPSNSAPDRARKLVREGNALMTFIAKDVLHVDSWEEDIFFR